MTPTIVFDLEKLRSLQTLYQQNLEFVAAQLPNINWKSPKQLKWFFKNRLDITLENAKIAHIAAFMERYDHDSPEYDLINGICTYLRLHFALKNYINYVLITANHEGAIELRDYGWQWCLQNRQPLPNSPDLRACIIAKGVPL